jgi:presenilin-like A22 family membrane protease
VRLHPFFYGNLILILSQVITFFVAFQEKDFLQERGIIPPELSLELPLLYFFGAVTLLGLILFLIPLPKLRIALKILFIFIFSWGMFLTLGFSLPTLVASLISIACGLLWFFIPRVWLHNLLMIFALAGLGSVFGFLFSPWTVIAFMLVISVYDVLAVRFGYMMWMVKKLVQSEVLPAFIIPREISNWKVDLKRAKEIGDESEGREFSILGGGDIAFPLLLIVSVFFAYGFAESMIVAVFSLLGLISAYLIQLFFLKAKPVPALPPITFVSFIGLLTVSFV